MPTFPATHMMKLGPFVFKVSTAAYQTLNRNTNYRWSAKERIGNFPAQQYMGKGSDNITLNGIIYPQYNPGAGLVGSLTGPVGTGRVEALREMALSGQPWILVDGTGKVYGRWVITSIQENQSIFFENGVPRKQEFAINLSKYDGVEFSRSNDLININNDIARLGDKVTVTRNRVRDKIANTRYGGLII